MRNKKIELNNIKNKFKINYTDILQGDGAFSIYHINYDKSPKFFENDSKNLAIGSRKNSITIKKDISLSDITEYVNTFDGTEKNYKELDRLHLWENYWLEYINTFDRLVDLQSNSVATVYIGREAIEIGIKYLLLKKTKTIVKTHDLGKLANMLFSEYQINLEYMKSVDIFCEDFCKNIEGGNPEYFRYPEYKSNSFLLVTV